MSVLFSLGEQAAHLVPLAAVPNPTGVQPPGGDKLITILDWFFWIVTALAVFGIMAVGARMFFAHRHGQGSEHMLSLGWVLAGCALIGSASGIAAVLI